MERIKSQAIGLCCLGDRQSNPKISFFLNVQTFFFFDYFQKYFSTDMEKIGES